MKMMKLFGLAAAAVCLLALAGCGGQSGGTTDETSESGNKVVRIGVYEPQTGDNGPGGKQEILGMQYANYVQPTVEIGGETYDVKLEIVDNIGGLADVSAYLGVKYEADASEEEIEAFYAEHGADVERQIPSVEEIADNETRFEGTPVS